jgi:hypothetical protein
MRPLKPFIFVLLLICCWCVHLHAQNDTSCKAPDPVSGQTKDQQQAAADGYLAACRAASAPDAHKLETEAEDDKQTKSGAQVDDAEDDKQTRSGAQVDEAVNVDVRALPHDQSKWQVDDYRSWFHQKGCPKLFLQAKKGLAGRTPDSQKIYLAEIVQDVKKQTKCN